MREFNLIALDQYLALIEKEIAATAKHSPFLKNKELKQSSAQQLRGFLQNLNTKNGVHKATLLDGENDDSNRVQSAATPEPDPDERSSPGTLSTKSLDVFTVCQLKALIETHPVRGAFIERFRNSRARGVLLTVLGPDAVDTIEKVSVGKKDDAQIHLTFVENKLFCLPVKNCPTHERASLLQNNNQSP